MNSDSVQALLRYLVPSGEKPIYIASQGGKQAQLSITQASCNWSAGTQVIIGFTIRR